MVLRFEIADDFTSALENARANGISVLSIFIDIFDSSIENFCWLSKYLKCAARKEAFYTAFGLENNGIHGGKQRRITVKCKGVTNWEK